MKNICTEYNATALQQLYKIITNEGSFINKDVFPISVIQAVFDNKTGTRLDQILSLCNCIYLPYQGTSEDTRLKVGIDMRRKGLIIVYRDLDNITHSERYIGDLSIADNSWKDSANWEECFTGFNDVGFLKKLKEYVTSEISNALSEFKLDLNLTVVDSLPKEGDSNTIYLVRNDESTEDTNLYDEYFWVNNSYEKLGSFSTSIDLSSYVTKDSLREQINQVSEELKQFVTTTLSSYITESILTERLSEYVSSSDFSEEITRLTSLINNKQDELVSGTNIKTVNGQSILGNGDITIESGDSYPAGGTVGQVLTKTESSVAWQDIPEDEPELPSDGNNGQVLTKTASGVAWQNVPTELPSGGTAGQVLKKTSEGVAWQDDNDTKYELPKASSSSLGGIKVGDGLEIDDEGTLNCTIDPGSGTVSWGNIQGKPTFATVATSGSYNDLSDKPTIPEQVTVDSSLSSSSINPVQNKVINSALSTKANTTDVYTKTEASNTFLSKTDASATYATKTELAEAAYELPIASATQLGGVKVGSGLSIGGDGTLNATGGGTADSVAWENVTGKPSTFTPSEHTHNVATDSTDGFMSSSDKTKLDSLSEYSLPRATDSVLGGVKTSTYMTVTSAGVLTPGNYLFRWPGNKISDLNSETCAVPGFYTVSSAATNGPEGASLKQEGGLQVILISARSNDVLYLKQILHTYINAYNVYTRIVKYDPSASPKVTQVGNWEVFNSETLTSSNYASYGKAGIVQGCSSYTSTVASVKNVLNEKIGGITFGNLGEVKISRDSLKLPLCFIQNSLADDTPVGTYYYDSRSSSIEVIVDSGISGTKTLSFSEVSPLVIIPVGSYRSDQIQECLTSGNYKIMYNTGTELVDIGRPQFPADPPVSNTKVLTQSEYDSLQEKDNNTVYFIKG